MRFPKLKEALFVERLNRFVGIILLEGRRYTAYIRNTGRLTELLREGNRVYVKPARGKHPFEIVLALYEGILVCIDSHIAPKLYVEHIGKACSFEPSFGDARFDLLVEGQPVEVKSVNLVKSSVALFPDAPTKRGTRHILKLIELSRQGYRPSLVFVVQRQDCELFCPNWEVDKDFAQALEVYVNQGLKVSALRCKVSLEEIVIEKEIPVVLKV